MEITRKELIKQITDLLQDAADGELMDIGDALGIQATCEKHGTFIIRSEGGWDGYYSNPDTDLDHDHSMNN